MSKSKHGATSSILVNDNIEYALKKFLRVSNSVISEHKKATEHYEKPSYTKHQRRQAAIHKAKIENMNKK